VTDLTSTVQDEALIRSVIDPLAVIPRLPTSAGERRAAELVRDHLARFGCRVAIEETPAHGSYALPIGLMCAVGAAAAWVGGRGRRWLGAVGGAIAAGGIADDISGGPMLFRRWFIPTRTACNVVATAGDPDAARTLVVLAHHDAAPSGVVFRQVVEEWLARNRPEIIEAMTSNPPMWWTVLAGPLLTAIGSALGRNGIRRCGLVLSLGALAAMVDIGSRPSVPGANDNLSGVAVLVALADILRRTPVRGLRVLLVSAGAEEALQQGIRGFARDHFPTLDPTSTTFLNFDTVGSGQLVLLEGEGPVRMRDYDAGFKNMVTECAATEGIPLRRGMRARSSTDGAVPMAHGYPTATVVSVDQRKLMPHYHLDSDLPEYVDLGSVAMAARLAEAVARRLALP
jgi:hypothetical protein